MDPNEYLRIVLDPKSPPSDRIDAVHNLSEWIARCGFPPDPKFLCPECEAIRRKHEQYDRCERQSNRER